jgi:hypothetical protein
VRTVRKTRRAVKVGKRGAFAAASAKMRGVMSGGRSAKVGRVVLRVRVGEGEVRRGVWDVR